MTRRATLFVAAFLWSAVALLNPVSAQDPASAQDRVPLRASHQGKFLPSGTEIIVLTKDAHVQQDGRYQPEFLPLSRFPRRGSGSTNKDRLAGNGRSGDSYTRTQKAGRLYFIYALAPDSTLYWSYSAQRDSLKYDVVSSGVMSVAPVLADDMRRDVLNSFFNRRVTVVMPADGTAGEKSADKREYAAAGDDRREQAGDDPRERTMADPDDETSHRGTDEPVDGHTDEAHDHRDASSARTLVQDRAELADDAHTGLRSGESSGLSLVNDSLRAIRFPVLAAKNSSGSTADFPGLLPPFLAYTILLFLIAAAAVPAVLARNYRRELRQVRREMLTLRNRAASETTGGQIHQQLEDAERRLQRIDEDYELLLLRYRALEKEVEG